MTSTATQSSGFLRAACRVLFGHPLVRWFNSRGRRRVLVAGYVLLLALFPTVTSMTNQLWPALVLLLPTVIASLLLGGVTDGLFDRPLSALDERQRHLRHTVFTNPYLTGASLGIAAGLLLAVALGSDRPATTGWSVAMLMLVFTLPTIVLAWKLPAEVDDGE